MVGPSVYVVEPLYTPHLFSSTHFCRSTSTALSNTIASPPFCPLQIDGATGCANVPGRFPLQRPTDGRPRLPDDHQQWPRIPLATVATRHAERSAWEPLGFSVAETKWHHRRILVWRSGHGSSRCGAFVQRCCGVNALGPAGGCSMGLDAQAAGAKRGTRERGRSPAGARASALQGSPGIEGEVGRWWMDAFGSCVRQKVAAPTVSAATATGVFFSRGVRSLSRCSFSRLLTSPPSSASPANVGLNLNLIWAMPEVHVEPQTEKERGTVEKCWTVTDRERRHLSRGRKISLTCDARRRPTSATVFKNAAALSGGDSLFCLRDVVRIPPCHSCAFEIRTTPLSCVDRSIIILFTAPSRCPPH